MRERHSVSGRGAGARLAALLVGSWRIEAPSLDLAREPLAGLEEALLSTGHAGLVWWRMRRGVQPPRRFRDAYRAQVAEADTQETAIACIVRLLGLFGVETILVKGWASARRYADAGLRPYGDIDLCVRPDQFEQAREILNRYHQIGLLDLHRGMPDLADRSWEQLVARSWVVGLNHTPIRLLGPEDHLRLIALHLVRHGAWRPLWLCDVAAAVEAVSDEFDWDYCLSGDRASTLWVLDTIGLAGRVLAARVDHLPRRVREHRIPEWVVQTVLWRWGSGRTRQRFRYYLRHPLEAMERLRYDGLNPIKATYRMGIRPNGVGLLFVVQLGAWLARVGELPRQVGRWFRRYPTVSQPQTHVVHR